jgi:predicted RNase H-like HicB family nuclease
VGAAQQTQELERYLAMPYRVAVRSSGDRKGSSWIAAVEELPGCEARGSTPDEAVEQLRPAMRHWLATALSEGRQIPVPTPETSKRKAASSHSGRFLVRMPSALHETLTHAAEREHVSLNRFVTDALASSVAPTTADSSTPGAPADLDDPSRTQAPPRRFRILLLANVALITLAAAAAITLLILALERGI